MFQNTNPISSIPRRGTGRFCVGDVWECPLGKCSRYVYDRKHSDTSLDEGCLRVVISSLYNDIVVVLIGRSSGMASPRFRHILRLDSMAKPVRRMNPVTRVYRRKEEVMDARLRAGRLSATNTKIVLLMRLI